ncbi:MAG: hypothetical protein OXI03_00445 [Chloroflexota bacterium]|nr:hypothetical protein [Chloroflexota bacterium]
MPTPDEARAAVDAARSDFSAAIDEAIGGWQKKPDAAEGEEAWSAQETANHVLGAEIFFARSVCEAAGLEGPRNPIKGAQISTPQEAQYALEAVTEAANAKVAAIGADDMSKPHEMMGTVEQAFTAWAGHLRDHAAQIRAAAAS